MIGGYLFHLVSTYSVLYNVVLLIAVERQSHEMDNAQLDKLLDSKTILAQLEKAS